MNILLTEDDDELRLALLEQLTDSGHKARGARNGREACAVMLEERFDALVTDIIMPERDGLELIAAFRQAYPQAPVIAMSGGGRALDEQVCENLAKHLGADRFLKKPFGFQEFVRVVESTQKT